MNKKSFLVALLAVCLMLALCACGGSEPAVDNGTEATQPTESTTTTTTASEVTTPTAPTPADGQVLYTINVVDADGNAKEGVYVQLCKDTCVFAPTDSEGNAYFCMPQDEYKVCFSEQPEIFYYFESGSREMTLVYELASAEPTETAAETEPSTNDAELVW